jgi:hypothetical protein
MITVKQAKQLKPGQILHHDINKNADGTCQRWRVNGQVKLWKTQPNRIYVPIKYGLKTYDKLNSQGDLDLVHLESDCPHG